MFFRSSPAQFKYALMLLSVLTSSIAVAAIVPNGGSVSGFLNNVNTGDTHTFNASDGQAGVVSVSGAIPGGAVYTITNPDGSLLVENTAQKLIELTQSGTYTVIVQRALGLGVGPYQFQLALAPGANEHGLIPNQGSAFQSIDVDGDIDSFTIVGFEGARGVLRMSGSVGGGKFMRIFAPDGRSINGSSSQITLNAMAPGIYTVVARSFLPVGTGDYELEWSIDCGSSADTDGDAVPDACDNCINATNATQLDTDNDGYGNLCDADFNQDCTVNVQDLGVLRSVFFSANADADLNGDGFVNIVDLGLLRTLFFSQPGPSSTGNCTGPLMR